MRGCALLQLTVTHSALRARARSHGQTSTWHEVNVLCRRAAELEGAEEANERARALLAEQRGKLAEAREFLQDRQESIAALQAQLAVKDAQVSPVTFYATC